MTAATDNIHGATALRRIGQRLVWIIMLAALVAMMDRLNLSYAALGMVHDVGITPQMLGLGSSLFFVAFLFAEIPSNLIMWKVGARRWIARIMVTWGLVSGAMALIQTPTHFYILRFLLGVAEAGFLPGMLLYLSLWIPEAQRGRFNSYLLFSIPIAGAITAIVSGLILQLDGLWGMAGWRLIFLFEAIPAVVLGVFIFFYLQDKPEDARWLSDDEKHWLRRQLDSEARPDTAHGSIGAILTMFRRPQIVVLSLGYFAVNMGVASLIWTPQMLEQSGLSVGNIAIVAGVLNAAAAIFMIFLARHSDKKRERTGHFVAAAVLAGVGFGLAGAAPLNLIPAAVGLGLASAGAFGALAVFWTVPQTILSPLERPGGLAAISLVGIVAGMINPLMVGALRENTGHYGGAMLISAVAVLIGAAAFWGATRLDSRARSTQADAGTIPN